MQGGVAGQLPGRKGPGGADQQQLNRSQQCPAGQEGQRHPGLDQKQCGQQDWGRDCCPVPSTGEATQ